MTWTDYYLKAPSKEAFDDALPDGWAYDYGSHTEALDVVGVIYDEEGNPRDGYHANLRLRGVEVPESLKPFLIDAPLNPKRVWA